MFKLDLEKAEEPEIKFPTYWIIKKARESQENIYFCFIDYAKAFNCVDHKKLWKILQEMRIPDQLTCLLRRQEEKGMAEDKMVGWHHHLNGHGFE